MPPPSCLSTDLFSGPLYYPFYGMARPLTIRRWRRRTTCRWQRPICDGSAKPRAGLGPSGRYRTARRCFVDGYYVGLAEEFGPGGRVIDFEAGAHHIELRAAGLRNADLQREDRAERHRPLSWRHAARWHDQAGDSRAACAVAARRRAKSFYVIPNCYAGDKPPTGSAPQGLQSEESSNA